MLLLLRHGDAEPGNGDDNARKLTPKGERQAVAAGEALAALGIEIDACLSSPQGAGGGDRAARLPGPGYRASS